MEEVLAKYFSKEASKEEISFVQNWKSQSETNAKEFFEAKEVWLSTEEIKEPSLTILKNILGEEPKQKQVFWNTSIFKYAAAASVVLLISIALILSLDTPVNYLSKDLSDGSVISLHSSSTFEIIKFDDNIREISVSGKAYFDIERNENRPFIIHTDNAIVKVLGTSFVIDTYNDKTEVLVESGLVELIKMGDDESVSVKLKKGETGLINSNNKGIIKGDNANVNYLSWKTKVLTFSNSSMIEVAKTLEDVYGITVEIENQNFNNCRLTARFSKKKPKDALEIIARTFNIEFEFSDGKAILKGKGC